MGNSHSLQKQVPTLHYTRYGNVHIWKKHEVDFCGNQMSTAFHSFGNACLGSTPLGGQKWAVVESESTLAPFLRVHLRLLRFTDKLALLYNTVTTANARCTLACLCLTATFKGKYAALGVLLPRVGALRLLDLCPSLVEQLVWAVGVRGNVSGQATTLLLEVLKAISTEVSLRVYQACIE